MTNITFEKLSRTAATGNPPQSGSSNAGTQYYPRVTNSFPLPSQSIVPGREVCQSIVDLRQFGAGLLFFLILLMAACGVTFGALLHKALVS